MSQKKYSINQIQEMFNFSPSELRKLMKENRRHIKLEVREDNKGQKETFMDEESFKKLLLLKQLEIGGEMSLKEAFELIEKPKMLDKPRNSDMFNNLSSSLFAMEEEVKVLSEQLKNLVVKYDHALTELNKSRALNISLKKEIDNLKTRQVALIGQFNQMSADEHDEVEVADCMVN